LTVFGGQDLLHFGGLAYSAFARNEGQALRGVKPKTPNSIGEYGNSLTLAKVKGCAGQIKPHDGIAWLLMVICLQAKYSCDSESVSTRPILSSAIASPIRSFRSGRRQRTAAPATTLLRASTSVQVRARRRSW